MSGIALIAMFLSLHPSACAPISRILDHACLDTTGLELPTNLLLDETGGKGALQIVINVRADSEGNIHLLPY